MSLDSIISEAIAQLKGEHVSAPCCPAQKSKFASCLEHSVVNPDMSADKILKACEEAKKYGAANVVVSPYFVKDAAAALKGSGVGIDVIIGFPHAASTTAGKVADIRESVKNGATELDLSICVNALKSKRYDEVMMDLLAMKEAAGEGILLKIIYEQVFMNEEEKKIALLLAQKCGIPFVKISNNFSDRKACVEDIRFVKSVVGDSMKIKIDGGIRTVDKGMELLAAGASRLGVSATVDLAEEALKRGL